MNYSSQVSFQPRFFNHSYNPTQKINYFWINVLQKQKLGREVSHDCSVVRIS